VYAGLGFRERPESPKRACPYNLRHVGRLEQRSQLGPLPARRVWLRHVDAHPFGAAPDARRGTDGDATEPHRDERFAQVIRVETGVDEGAEKLVSRYAG
jgi:hypothetical protein